jgi:hypothetical protein
VQRSLNLCLLTHCLSVRQRKENKRSPTGGGQRKQRQGAYRDNHGNSEPECTLEGCETNDLVSAIVPECGADDEDCHENGQVEDEDYPR